MYGNNKALHYSDNNIWYFALSWVYTLEINFHPFRQQIYLFSCLIMFVLTNSVYDVFYESER